MADVTLTRLQARAPLNVGPPDKQLARNAVKALKERRAKRQAALDATEQALARWTSKLLSAARRVDELTKRAKSQRRTLELGE